MPRRTLACTCGAFAKTSYPFAGCSHIFGHLLLVQEKANTEKATAVYRQVSRHASRFECLSGVLMENLTRPNLIDRSLADKPAWNEENTSKIEALCRSLSGEAAMACWKEISYAYIALANAEPEELFRLCGRARYPIDRNQCCLYGAGNMVMFSTFDMERLPEVCTVYRHSDPLYRRCVYQVAGALLTSSPKLKPHAFTVCTGAHPTVRAGCLRHIEDIVAGR